MRLRSVLFIALLLVSAVLAGAEEGAERAAEDVAKRIAEQIRRLEGSLALLSGLPEGQGSEAEESATQTEPDAVTLRLVALRQEIDQLLILLEAQAPEVRAEVGRLLVGEAPAEVSDVASQPAARDVVVPEVELESNNGPEPAAEPVAEPTGEAACVELTAFDTNEDGVVSGLDRYWRYFRLWRDNGNGTMEEKELRGLYDSGVGELTVALGTYRTVDGEAGEVQGGGLIRLDLGPKSGGVRVLTLDADRLARGGELQLLAADGARLTGRQALDDDMQIALADGRRLPLACD